MNGGQGDLFCTAARPEPPRGAQPGGAPRLDAGSLADEALVAAIAGASLVESGPLAGEAARRRLAAAIPALEALCRRFTGFGGERLVPEQVAALTALAEIGGGEAGQAVARLIARRMVQGPTLAIALAAAVRLKLALPAETALPLLGDADPAVRADACRCLPRRPALVPALVALLADRHEPVRTAAACALGRMGRVEARPALHRLLQTAPGAEAIDAAIAVADEACCVSLGRIARSRSTLAAFAREALQAIDDPLAERILAGIERLAGIRDQDSD